MKRSSYSSLPAPHGWLTLAALLLGLAACSSRTAVVTGDGAPDLPRAADSAPGPGDLAQPGQEGTGKPDIPLLPIQGRIFLTEQTDVRINHPGVASVQIEFTDSYWYDSGFNPLSKHGECAFGEMAPPPPSVPNWVDGGKVRITGSDHPPLTYRFPLEAGPYVGDLPHGASSVFSDGQVLAINGEGGGAAVKAPFAGSLAAPADLLPSYPHQASSTSPLTIQWNAAGADEVRVALRCSGRSLQDHRVVCLSPDDGVITIAAPALTALSGTCTILEVAVERRNAVHLPSSEATIIARAALRRLDGLQLQ